MTKDEEKVVREVSIATQTSPQYVEECTLAAFRDASITEEISKDIERIAQKIPVVIRDDKNWVARQLVADVHLLTCLVSQIEAICNEPEAAQVSIMSIRAMSQVKRIKAIISNFNGKV